MIVVYENPSDFPGKFVARKFTIGPGVAVADVNPEYVGEKLGPLRARLVRRGLTRIPRASADDPVIVEVWL